MAVEIDLELQAGDVAGEIVGIAGALETLDDAASDADLDLDLDIDDIEGSIGNIVDQLNNLDLDPLSQELDRLEALQDGEIDLKVTKQFDPDDDGAGGGGGRNTFHIDSGFGQAADMAQDAGTSATDSSSRANLYERIYGSDATLMGDSDIGQLIKQTNAEGSNLGEFGPAMRDFQDLQRVGTRSGFGLDSVANDLRRSADSISREGFLRGADPTDKPLSRSFIPRIDDRINTRNIESLSAAEEIQELNKRAKSISEDANFRLDFTDFNEDARNAIPETDNEIRLSSVDGPRFREGGGIDAGGSSLRNVLGRTFGDGPEDSDLNYFDRLGKRLRKFKPTMGKYMQLLAALIPIAVALGTQLLGVAAAMGSVAVAGGAILGLGLLGHGDSLAQSMGQAKREIKDLKQELFETFQPTAQLFAPIQSKAFDAIPGAMSDISTEMRGLVAFEDTLFNLGAALAGGIEQFFAIINNNQEAISQLTTRFGGLIGSGLLQFFEWLIQSASKNQELLVQVGRDMLKLVTVAFNLSMAIVKVLSAFSPLIDLLVFVSELLNSGVIIGLITMAGWLFVLGKSATLVYALYGAFTTLSSGIANAALMMFGYEMSTWGAVAATLALVAAVGALTLGASAVIGGAVTSGVMSGSDIPTGPGGGGGPAGGGAQTVYNDNRSFTINQDGDDYASQKSTEDTVKEINATNASTETPRVNPTSEESD